MRNPSVQDTFVMLKEKGIEIDKDDLTTVKEVRDAMDEIVPGPMKVMKWIESVVSEVIKGGAEEICWTTPSGFEVTQTTNEERN
jgi:hypothetical protein